MIWIDGKEVSYQLIDGVNVETMWLNGHPIWYGIRSCYGSGAWINDKPFLNNDGWKN